MEDSIQKQAASAIRDLVDKVESLEEEKGLYDECIKIAFELAENGQIESDHDSIMKKAHELLSNRDEIPVVKKALEYNTNYTSVGNMEKEASSEVTNSAEAKFLKILQGI